MTAAAEPDEVVPGPGERCRKGMMHQVLDPASGGPTEQAGRLQRTAASLHARRRSAEAEALAGTARSQKAGEPDAAEIGRISHALAGTLADIGDRGGAEAL
jgi:hypothetical protein